jgi:histidinol-phosphate aminotransferase
MNKFWSKLIKQLSPYIPGEQPKNQALIKLNTNENPYGPSPKVLAALKLGVSDKLKLYPDPESTELRESIAKFYNVRSSNIFVGNGSDEILAFIFQGFFKKSKPLLFPNITYSFYPVYCKLYDIAFQKMPLDKNFEINLQDYLIPNGGIIFPNPNAPTGIPKGVSDIENLLKNNKDSVVVIDEAYVDFGTESSVYLIKKYDNLIVTQSLSKSRSLAGMRIGCAFASKSIVEGLNRIKNSFNSYPVDRLAQIAGAVAFSDEDYFRQTTKKVIEARQFLVEEMSNLDFQILPSGANFIFTKHNNKRAELIFKELRNNDILIRFFESPEEINNYLRITVGSMEQMKQLVHVIKKII